MKKARQKVITLALAAVLIVGLAGCGTDWESTALDLLELWANTHDVNPTTAGGAVNLIRRTASDSTGDEDADAALDYNDVIENIEEDGEQPPESPTLPGTESAGASTTTGDTIAANPAGHVEGFLVGEVGGDENEGTPEGGQSGQPALGATWDQMVDELSETVETPTNIDAASTEAVFETIQDLIYQQDPETGLFERTRTSGHDVVNVTLTSGESMQIGIVTAPDGSVLYTADGSHFYSDLENITDPGMAQQVDETYNAIKDRAWQALFEGSTGDKDIDLQNRAASEVMDDLREQLDDEEKPQSASEWIEGELWDKHVKEPLQGGVQDMLWDKAEEYLQERVESGSGDPSALERLQRMKDQFDDSDTTIDQAWEDFRQEYGLDLFDLVEVDGIKAGEWAVSGAQFALDSIKTMGRGLQDTDFALRSRAYNAERAAGHTPEQIWQRMRNGELPELDIGGAKFASGGVSSMMASGNIARDAQMGVMFTMFEQSYQRYSIARDLGK